MFAQIDKFSKVSNYSLLIGLFCRGEKDLDHLMQGTTATSVNTDAIPCHG